MQYESYLQVDRAVERLLTEKQYDAGITLLESVKKQFPERLFDILVNEMLICLKKGDMERCLDIIEESLKIGFFFYMDWRVFDPIRENNRFKAAFEPNRRLWTKFQAQAKMTYQVFLPKNYSPDGRYPMFMALHGEGSAIETFKEQWEPVTMLDQGFIVVYIQSSQVICTNGYRWMGDWKKTREEITTCYDEVMQNHPIDPEKVIVGGFSGGGIAAIEIALANIFPIKGFITMSAGHKPESFTRERVEKTTKRGVKAVLMQGEQEQTPESQQMVQILDESGLVYQKVIFSGGHEFPEDFPEMLAEAIKFVMS
jgi:predicted esterase